MSNQRPTSGRLTRYAAGLSLAILTTACLQPSLNPLFLPEDTFFDDTVLGTWTCPGEVWTFARASYEELPDHPFYKVTIGTSKADGKADEFAAWLGRLDQTAFVTVRPEDLEMEPANDFVGSHILSTYTFGRIDIKATTLRIDMLDSEWAAKAEAAGQLTIGVRRWLNDLVLASDLGSRPSGSRHTPRTEPLPWLSEVILTAQPKDLQRFARVYADDDGVFGEKIELVRQPPLAVPASTLPATERGSCFSAK